MNECSVWLNFCMLWRRRNHWYKIVNPLNAEVNPICRLQALLGAHHILHISRIRVKYKTDAGINMRKR